MRFKWGTQEEALCSHFCDTHPHTSSDRFPTQENEVGEMG